MCNGINKSNGKQCGRKAEWCSQHINQKPAEESVADQKKEESELIEAEEKIVSENIVSPMSPNATSISATEPELPIVEAEKSEPIENNSTQGTYLPIEVFDVKDADKAHLIVDDIYIYKACFRFAEEAGLPVGYFKSGEMRPHLEDGKSCVQYPFFTCSEDVFNKAQAVGKQPKPKGVISLVFDSDADRDLAIDYADKQFMSGVNMILKTKDYDEYLYDLCCLLPLRFFDDRKHLNNFTRMVHQMPGKDPMLMRRTFAAIMKFHQGEYFNELVSMSSYDTDGPNTKFPIAMDIGKLKAAAGGANTEAYKAWKAKYEPEPIKSDEDSERKSKKPSVVLKGKIIDVVKDTYRREFSTGVIFKKKTDYFYTRKFADPREFLNHIFVDDEMYQMCSQSDHKELLHFIKDIAHPNFPFMKLDHSYMGFRNGVYCLDDATFREGADIPKNIQVRVYYDMDWDVPIETPLLDAFFARQFNLETTDFIYFMLGRTLTKLKDKFDFMVMLFGLGGTGKSLLMNLLCYAFGPAQVGIFGSTYQDCFGMSEFATKQIVASDDMPRNIAKTLPKSDFLSMQSRGRISCPVKGKGSIEVDSWLIPTIINSNDMPNYSDTSGEIIRRIMIIHFDNAIPDDEKDIALEDKIKATEFCAFIHRCRSTYLRYCKDYAGRNAYTFCPQHFLNSRDMLRGSSNESYQFAKDHIKYVAPQEGKPSAMIPKAELKKMFSAYIKEKYNLSRPGKQTLDLDSLVSADPRTLHSAVNICKSCRNKHVNDCCAEYSRTNRSKAEFILNAQYAYHTSNE